jgi:hypothetical protein
MVDRSILIDVPADVGASGRGGHRVSVSLRVRSGPELVRGVDAELRIEVSPDSRSGRWPFIARPASIEECKSLGSPDVGSPSNRFENSVALHSSFLPLAPSVVVSQTIWA